MNHGINPQQLSHFNPTTLYTEELNINFFLSLYDFLTVGKNMPGAFGRQTCRFHELHIFEQMYAVYSCMFIMSMKIIRYATRSKIC